MFKQEKERRRFPRVKVQCLLQYVLEGSGKKVSYVKDISAGGVLFHSKEDIPENTLLDLEISLPKTESSLKMQAKIIRTKPLKGMEGFEIGAEFINIDENIRHLIKQST